MNFIDYISKATLESVRQRDYECYVALRSA